MNDHLGLIEMLSIFGIGIALVVIELIRTNLAIRRDGKKLVEPSQPDEAHEPSEKH
jgi:hypothetical protein